MMPDERYVGDPKKGFVYNRGEAVDLTLVDAQGTELIMPTGFDDFTEKAYLDYPDFTGEQLSNRALLRYGGPWLYAARNRMVAL